MLAPFPDWKGVYCSEHLPAILCISQNMFSGYIPGLFYWRIYASLALNKLNGTWWTKFGEILIKIHIFSSKKIHVKIMSAKLLAFCLVLDVITRYSWLTSNILKMHGM